MVHASHASARRLAAALAVALCSLSCTTEHVEARDTELDEETVGAGRSDARWSRSRGRIPYGFNGVPWLGQFQEPWGSLQYGDELHCSPYSEGGCGPTAFAMVLRYHGRTVTPDGVGAIAVANGARRCSGGTAGFEPEFLNALTSTYGVNATLVHRDHSRVLEFLRAKQPVIAVGRCSGYTAKRRSKTYSAHFLVLTGEDVIRHRGEWRRVIRVNDPGNPQGVGIAYMTVAQLKRMGRFIHLAPSETEQPVVAFAPSSDSARFTRCDRTALRARQQFLEFDTLSDNEWVDYGRALAACDPRSRPWEALGAGDRERFLDQYVIPFVNGDAVRGSAFQRSDPRRYADLVRVWGLEG
jgi:hypothetical protein